MPTWNLLFRRLHLYLGLVLLPWMAMYAISTIFFNHGAGHGGQRPEWRLLWEKPYKAEVPAGDDALRTAVSRIIAEQGMRGPFGAQRQGTRLVITLPYFLQPTRLTYDATAGQLRAEVRADDSIRGTFDRLHSRTGYGRGSILSDVWAFFVDLFCFATFAWIGTGLYLWWKLSATRRWGFVALLGGFGTIALLLVAV